MLHPKVTSEGHVSFYSSFANRALPFVTATPSFLAFSTISKRFFAPTAEATINISPTTWKVTNFSGICSIIHQKHIHISCIVDKENFMS